MIEGVARRGARRLAGRSRAPTPLRWRLVHAREPELVSEPAAARTLLDRVAARAHHGALRGRQRPRRLQGAEGAEGKAAEHCARRWPACQHPLLAGARALLGARSKSTTAKILPRVPSAAQVLVFQKWKESSATLQSDGGAAANAEYATRGGAILIDLASTGVSAASRRQSSSSSRGSNS